MTEKNNNRIKLSDHFTYGRLFRFVIPSIGMMIFTSIYSVVDGLFVSNFVGKTAFAGINLIMPVFLILGAVGYMLGTGGAALVGKVLGEGRKKYANELFSMFVYVTAVVGIIMIFVGLILLKPLAVFLGAEGMLLKCCMDYGWICMLSTPFYMLQEYFQLFFITAEKPKLGFKVIVLAGVTNMVLDALFIIAFGWGIQGAAIATGLAEAVGSIVPIIYFARKNDSLLRLGRAKVHWKAIGKACTNGCSEFISCIAISFVNLIYNYQLMRIAGEDGVAAYGVVMYLCFLFFAVFGGYQMGSAPLFSYNLGSDNRDELRNLFVKSVKIMVGVGIAMTVVSELLAVPLCKVFVGYDSELCDMTITGMRLIVLCFIVSGYNIFSSSLFTALNNGLISAVISFLRAIGLECTFILVLPHFFGLTGVWLVMPATELITMMVATAFIVANRKKYHYL